MMKQRGHVVDEAVCFILVRLCYNQLRDAWYPGGYPPKRSSVKVHDATTLFSHNVKCMSWISPAAF